MPNDKDFELDDLDSFSFDEIPLEEEGNQSLDSNAGDDEFGVWVKSAPEDLDDVELESPAPDEVLLADEDSLSVEELANLGDQFDLVAVSAEPLEGESLMDDEDLSLPDLDLPDFETSESNEDFAEISLDDFVSFDTPGHNTGTETMNQANVFEVSAGAEDEDKPSEEFLDIDIDINDDIDDEELEILEGAQVVRDEPEATTSSLQAETVDLSEFGDFGEIDELTLEDPVTETVLVESELTELGDLPDLEHLPELEVPETDFMEPTSDQDASAFADFASDLTADDLTLDSGDLGNLELPDEELDSTVLEPADETDMEQLRALEADLTSGLTPAPVSAPEPTDRATAILSKIEQELSSIKRELSELKSEVTHLRPYAPTNVVASPEVEVPNSSEDSAPHGFFDEEDDETIALTGDELDNILSTAEISEAEDSGQPLDEDLILTDEQGNIVNPEPAPEPGHVTDEEFLAGTPLGLELDETTQDDFLAADWDEAATTEAHFTAGDEELRGVPASIELEEALPDVLDDQETEDLLGGESEGFAVEPLPPGIMEPAPAVLDIPFDDDIQLDEEDGPVEAIEEITMAPEPTIDESFTETVEVYEAPAVEDSELPTFEPPVPEPAPLPQAPLASGGGLSDSLKTELKAVLTYMDKLLASLPDDKIQEFAESEHFEVYKKLFEELGLIE